MLGPLPLLILQSCLIIVVARAVGVLARRLGQPAVIAEVIAGIMLGPSLLGRVSPPLSLALFPKSSLSGLSLLSQIGLVFFMFLIGLELDPKLLRGRGAIDHGLSRAFAPESTERRVLVALSGGGQDARVLDFAEQLLRDKTVSLSLLLVTPPDGVVSDTARAALLAAAQPTRVSMRSEPSAARHAILLTAASQADLVLIGLDPSWGLSADGLDAAAARLVIACPASLLVIRERSAHS